MRVVVKILIGVTAIVAIGWCFVLGDELRVEDHQKAYDMIRNVAGVMFGVFGLWIGLLYPDLKRKIFKKNNGDEPQRALQTTDNEEQANALLQPFFCSLAILLTSLVIGVSIPLIEHLSILEPHKKVVKGFSYSFVGLLALVQIWTIWNAMQLTDLLKSSIDRSTKRRESRERRRQNRNGDS